jgi:hypothetical protein
LHESSHIEDYINMKVFMSWSGERSRFIAEIFYRWLPTVIQNLEPWMSEHDIDKGTKPLRQLGRELHENFFGLICLTPENLREPWVNYEAGALSKDEENSRVWTMLYELQYSDVKGPLAQFQHTRLEKIEIFKMLQAMNAAGGVGMTLRKICPQFRQLPQQSRSLNAPPTIW